MNDARLLENLSVFFLRIPLNAFRLSKTMRFLPLPVCFIFALILVQPIAYCASEEPWDEDQERQLLARSAEPWSPEDENSLGILEAALGGVSVSDVKPVDVKMEIVKNFMRVRKYEITPEEFYKRLGAMDVPGRQMRHVLMEIKKDVGKHLGTKGLERVFGKQFGAGGSLVEARILSHRRKIVMEEITGVIRDFAGRNVIDGQRFSVFVAEVGSWPLERLEQMTLAGDIDFSFISGNLELALAMKQAFDQRIRNRLGKAPEDLDMPCTAHGMATHEVYVGKHGQEYAESATKEVKRVNFGDQGGEAGLGGKVEMRDAMLDILVEAKLASVRLQDLGEIKWKTEPGRSLEMIRHFEHDIVKPGVHSDLDSFLKAAKLAERSFAGLEKFGGIPDNPALRDFVQKFSAEKYSAPDVLARHIREYMSSTGQDFPFEAKLVPTSDGKSSATLKANDKLIKSFWQQCTKAMWSNANVCFRKALDDFTRRIETLNPDDIDAGRRLKAELDEFREMVEIEDRVLRDSRAGVEKLDSSYQSLKSRFDGAVVKFQRKAGMKVLDPKTKSAYAFVVAQLKKGTELNLRMAAAAMLAYPCKVNDLLDFMDNKLLDSLRRGTTDDYVSFLRDGEELSLRQKADRFVGRTENLDDLAVHANKRKGMTVSLENGINKVLYNNCVARKIQGVNRVFEESIKNSAAGSAMMQGMVVFSLTSEITAYVELAGQGKWEELGVECFRRRVPFGGAVERYYLGDYWGMAWEVTAVLIPPASLFSTAMSVGEQFGHQFVEFEWFERMEHFKDTLYENAKFDLTGVEKIGEDIRLSRWRLKTLSYQGKTFDIDEMISMEARDARAMSACLQPKSDGSKPNSDEIADCFPFSEVRNGIFEWTVADDVLKDSLGRNDPVLAMYDEMKQTGLVGPKLREYFNYHEMERWERLKVQFLQQLKERLEEKRGAEQIVLTGKTPVLFDELLRIGKALGISDLLRKTIDGSTEQGFAGSVGALKDWLRGGLRGYSGEPDIWSRYDEYTRVLVRLLDIYRVVLEARTHAEGIFLQDGWFHELGVRVLTGPYFLTGEPSADQREATRWVGEVMGVQALFEQRLQQIKSANDAGLLDRAEGSYDMGMLRAVVLHDVFRLLWSHVAKKTPPSGQTPAFFSSVVRDMAGEETNAFLNERGDYDLAMEGLRRHAAEVKVLLEQFEEHYRKKDAQSEDGNMDAAMLERLRRAQEQARSQADETAVRCGEARGLLEEAERLISADEKVLTGWEQRQLRLDVSGAARSGEVIASSYARAEELTWTLERITVQAEERSEVLCRRVDMIKTGGHGGDVQASTAEVDAVFADLARMFFGTDEIMNGLDAALQEVGAAHDSLQRAAAGGDADVRPVPPLVGERRESILVRAEGAVEEARQGLDRLWNYVGDLRDEVAPLLVEDAPGEQVEVVNLLGAVEEHLARVNDCPEEVGRNLQALRERQVALGQRAERAHAAIGPSGPAGSRDAQLIEEQVAGIGFLLELAEAYRARMQVAVDSARICRDAAVRFAAAENCDVLRSTFEQVLGQGDLAQARMLAERAANCAWAAASVGEIEMVRCQGLGQALFDACQGNNAEQVRALLGQIEISSCRIKADLMTRARTLAGGNARPDPLTPAMLRGNLDPDARASLLAKHLRTKKLQSISFESSDVAVARNASGKWELTSPVQCVIRFEGGTGYMQGYASYISTYTLNFTPVRGLEALLEITRATESVTLSGSRKQTSHTSPARSVQGALTQQGDAWVLGLPNGVAGAIGDVPYRLR